MASIISLSAGINIFFALSKTLSISAGVTSLSLVLTPITLLYSIVYIILPPIVAVCQEPVILPYVQLHL